LLDTLIELTLAVMVFDPIETTSLNWPGPIAGLCGLPVRTRLAGGAVVRGDGCACAAGGVWIGRGGLVA